MSRVVLIPHVPGWGVGDHHVRRIAVKLPPQTADLSPHLALGVLIFPTVVPGASAQTQEPVAVVFQNSSVNAVTAFGRPHRITGVVVSPDVKYGAPGHGHKEHQILGLQVAAGDDQVVFRQTPGNIVVPQGGAFLIRQDQYLHGVPPFLRAICSGRSPAPAPWAAPWAEAPARTEWSLPRCCTASPCGEPRRE